MTPGRHSAAWTMARGRSLPLDRPRVMAILNVTPDSFSDAGRLATPQAAVDAALLAAQDGADLLDIGGESTRPGAAPVGDDEQIARVVPAVRAVRALRALDALGVSVDTTRAAVARAALDAGADAINDVSAGLDDPGMLELAARRGAGLILMHRLRPPGADEYSDRYPPGAAPRYDDVVASVGAFLRGRADAALHAGVERGAVVLDPGLGFGKTVAQNLELVRRTDDLLSLGFPLLGAASRKSFVGRTASPDRETAPADRLGGSIAFSVVQLSLGVRLFRVHDVREQARALRSAWALLGPGGAA